MNRSRPSPGGQLRDGRSPGGHRPLVSATTVATVVVAQLLAAVVCLAALWAGAPLWGAALPAVCVGAAMFVPVGGRFPVSWAAAAWSHVRGERPDLGFGEDFRSPGETVGLHWIDGQAAAVVELRASTRSWTLISRGTYTAADRVPLPVLAGCLEQNDVTLSGIDVVAHGSRAVGGTPAADVYDALTGPLPATSQRIVWVALRFDLATNEASVARRGGGVEGASRTLAVAARRVVRALADAGCPARILSAAEIDSACARVCRGVHPAAMTDRWDHVPLGDLYNVGNAVDPRHLNTETMTRLWAAPSLGTTVSLRLRRGPEPGSVRVGASLRRTTRTLPERLSAPGLISAQGRQRDSLLAHLPVSSPRLDGLVPYGEFDADHLGTLSLPVAGCGQLVGSDAHGNAVAARLSGPGVAEVHLAGEHYLARQIVFRAVATGARVLVHTDRPHAWAPLVDAVATPTRLRLAGESSWSDTGFDTVVVDGAPTPPARAGVTLIHVHDDPRQWPRSTPDVSVLQPGGFGDRVVLTIGEHRIDLALVTISSETAFTGRPATAASRPVAAH